MPMPAPLPLPRRDKLLQLVMNVTQRLVSARRKGNGVSPNAGKAPPNCETSTQVVPLVAAIRKSIQVPSDSLKALRSLQDAYHLRPRRRHPTQRLENSIFATNNCGTKLTAHNCKLTLTFAFSRFFFPRICALSFSQSQK